MFVGFVVCLFACSLCLFVFKAKIIICDFSLSPLIRGYCLCVTESGFNLCVKSELKQEGCENDHQRRLQYRKCVHVFVLTESESEKIKEGMKEEVL